MNNNYIAGEWRQGSECLPNINPSNTNDVIGRYAIASTGDVEDAVSAALAALPVWSSSTSGERYEILDGIGSEIVQRKDELGDLLAREEGKTLKDAVAEAHRAGSLFKFFAAVSLKIFPINLIWPISLTSSESFNEKTLLFLCI